MGEAGASSSSKGSGLYSHGLGFLEGVILVLKFSNSGTLGTPSNGKFIWGIVKIMVPFWVPLIRPRIIIGTQKGTTILTIPHMGLRVQGLGLQAPSREVLPAWP